MSGLVSELQTRLEALEKRVSKLEGGNAGKVPTPVAKPINPAPPPAPAGSTEKGDVSKMGSTSPIAPDPKNPNKPFPQTNQPEVPVK